MIIPEEYWQLNTRNSTDRMDKALQYRYKTDCMFLVGVPQDGKKLFQLHKLPLMLVSSVFERMFSGDFKEGEKGFVVVNDVPVGTFELIQNFAYNRKVKINSFNEAVNLAYAAHKYLIDGLIRKVRKFICNNINDENVIRAFELGNFFNMDRISRHAKEYIQQRTAHVLEAPSFLEMGYPTLLKMLDENHLNVTEIDLLNKIVKWVENYCSMQGIGCSHKKEVKREIVKKIRFLSIEPHEFDACENLSKLLTQNEQRRISNALSSKGLQPLPKYMNSSFRRFGSALHGENHEISWREDIFCSEEPSGVFSFNFFPDKAIYLLGFLVFPSLINGPLELLANPTQIKLGNTKFLEHFNISLDSGQHIEINFKMKVDHNRFIKVYLKDEFLINPKEKCTVTTTTFNKGLYNCVQARNYHVFEDTTFHFERKGSVRTPSPIFGFIFQLVEKKPKVDWPNRKYWRRRRKNRFLTFQEEEEE